MSNLAEEIKDVFDIFQRTTLKYIYTCTFSIGIIRYLAGRFPETTSAVDDNGRTALHYAATLKDNGHFFNLLTNLGANPKADDSVSTIPCYFT